MSLCCAANAATIEAEQFVALDTLARVRLAGEQLRRPVTVSERFGPLRAYSQLWREEREPHHLAIETLAASQITASAFALANVLRDARYPYRVEVAWALTREPHTAAIPALVEAAAAPDAELRRAAITALGVSLATRSAAPYIEDVHRLFIESMSRDPDPEVREAALLSLVKTGGLSAVNAAIQAGLGDESVLLRCQALRLLAFFGARSKNHRISRSTRGQLWLVVDRTQQPGILARAWDTQRHTNRLEPQGGCIDLVVTAVRNLGVLASSEDVVRLGSLASGHADPSVREAAVSALFETGDSTALNGILPALSDENIAVRRAAVKALTAFAENERAENALVAMLESGSPLDRQAAAQALVGISGHSEALVRALGDDSVQVRRAVERALLEQADPASVPPLVEALGQAPRVARRAARILAALDVDTGEPLLIATLESRDPVAAPMAALALGLRGWAGARPALESAAFDQDDALAVASIRALQDLDRPESLPTLLSIAESAGEPRREAAARIAALVIGSTHGAVGVE